MTERLEPDGTPVMLGTTILRTPGLAGFATLHLPVSPTLRAACSTTAALEAVLADQAVVPQQTIEIADATEIDLGPAAFRGTAFGEPALEVSVPDPGDEWGQFLLASDESGVITWNFAAPVPEEATTRGAG